MKFTYYATSILILLSSTLFAQDITASNKKCKSTSVSTYVKSEKSFDFAQSCSAVEMAVEFAKSESFLNKDAKISIEYKTLTSIGYQFPNSFDKLATNYPVLSKIQLNSFYSEEVHSRNRTYFGLNAQTSDYFSERQRIMVLKALHHSVIVYETIHSLINSYLETRPEIKLSYGEIEAIAIIGQLKSISPSLRKVIIDLNKDTIDITFGYQDLVNHIENDDDQSFGVNSFLKYKNGTLKIQELLKL